MTEQPTPRKPKQTGQPAQKPPVHHQPSHDQAPTTVTLPRWALIALIAVAAVLLIVAIVLGVRSCSTTEEPTQEPAVEEWVCPYDWNNLMTQANGLLAYAVDDTIVSEAGVDVSEHDGTIDWAAVKADGVDFAMIRLGYRGYGTEGTINLDPYFVENITNAKAAGLKVGVYFFSQAITEAEAREEAKFVVDQLASAGVALDYPVAFDEEPITNGDVARTDGITDAQLTKNAIAFCQAIEAAGYTPVIYGNQHDLGKLDLTGDLAKYEVWLAEYETATPTAQTDYAIWQYTEHGTVDGIPVTAGWVDVNIRFIAK